MNKTIIISILLIIALASFASAETVYQENANSTDCTGSWAVGWPCSNSYDGDWDTFAIAYNGALLSLNYSKPADSLSAMWQVKDSAGLYNLTIPDSCFNADANILMLQANAWTSDWETFYLDWQCYNGTGLELLGESNYFGYGQPYEEGIYWNITAELPNCSVCNETCSPCGGGCTATNLDSMFDSITDFNNTIGDITGWNTSCITNTQYMFYNSDFNQNISGWDMSNVIIMEGMFSYDAVFNQPIGSWNTSKVENMNYVFEHATAFNQPLDSWNTDSTMTMGWTFVGATSFDQDISSWNVTNVHNDLDHFGMTDMFGDGAGLSTINYDALLNGWAAQSVQNNVIFNGGNSQYSSAALSARNDTLIGIYGWTITDGGLAPFAFDGDIESGAYFLNESYNISGQQNISADVLLDCQGNMLNGSASTLFSVQGDNVTLDNCVFKGNMSIVINASGFSDLTISGNIYSGDPDSFLIFNGGNLTFEDNILANATFNSSIVSIIGDTVIIHNNTFSNLRAKNFTFRIVNTSMVTSDLNDFKDINCTNGTNSLIGINSSNMTVENSSFKNINCQVFNGGTVTGFDVRNSFFENCNDGLASGSSATTIYMGTPTSVSIINNIFNRSYDVLINTISGYSNVSNNLFYDPFGCTGVSVGSMTNSYAINNTITVLSPWDSIAKTGTQCSGLNACFMSGNSHTGYIGNNLGQLGLIVNCNGGLVENNTGFSIIFIMGFSYGSSNVTVRNNHFINNISVNQTAYGSYGIFSARAATYNATVDFYNNTIDTYSNNILYFYAYDYLTGLANVDMHDNVFNGGNFIMWARRGTATSLNPVFNLHNNQFNINSLYLPVINDSFGVNTINFYDNTYSNATLLNLLPLRGSTSGTPINYPINLAIVENKEPFNSTSHHILNIKNLSYSDGGGVNRTIDADNITFDNVTIESRINWTKLRNAKINIPINDQSHTGNFTNIDPLYLLRTEFNISNLLSFVMGHPENSTTSIDNSYGTINFTTPANLSGTYDFDTAMEISNRSIYVNESLLPGTIAAPAWLTFKNTGLLNVSYVHIFKDLVACPVDVCTNISLVAGNVIFLVTGFSNYSLGSGCTADTDCGFCMKCSAGSCVNENVSEDLKNECSISTNCSNAYTIASQSGFCNGYGICDAVNNSVSPGHVCVAGDELNASASAYCGIWSDCVLHAYSANEYYAGYNSDGSCNDTDWQAAGITQSAPANFWWSASGHMDDCSVIRVYGFASEGYPPAEVPVENVSVVVSTLNNLAVFPETLYVTKQSGITLVLDNKGDNDIVIVKTYLKNTLGPSNLEALLSLDKYSFTVPAHGTATLLLKSNAIQTVQGTATLVLQDATGNQILIPVSADLTIPGIMGDALQNIFQFFSDLVNRIIGGITG